MVLVPDGFELDENLTVRTHDGKLIGHGYTLTNMSRAVARSSNRQEFCDMNEHTMTTTHASTRPRGTPAVYTLDDLERIERSISSAPLPERQLTTSDALAALAPALSKARDKGHSLAGLVQLCVQQGLHVSERAVSRAISTVRASKTAKRKQAASAA